MRLPANKRSLPAAAPSLNRSAVVCAAVKGSTMDAMSDAIEGAEVLLYGVSLKYKESASEAATTSRLGCHL